jgi:trehalose 6-phosphate phosphatase
VTIGSLLAPLLADPAGALVACDYDGTLAPIVGDPGQAYPAPGAVEALTVLAGLVGQVAVITGRAALDAVRIGGLHQVPGLVVLGLYGTQRWTDGLLTAADPPPGLEAARAAAADLLRSGDAGVRLEDKGGSFAVHTRQAADPKAALDRLREPLTALAAEYGLRIEPGRHVLELRSAAGGSGSDKGAALLRLASDLPATSVLFAGDDLGDLAAFEAVKRLRSNGLPAWAVAAASLEAPAVAGAADLVVDGPAGVVELLVEIAQLLG